MTCGRVITRHYLTSEWGAWLHNTDIGVRVGRLHHRQVDHAAIPRETDPYPQVDPFDHTDIGDWSQLGKIGPTSTDRHCPDCGAEVTLAGRQCPRCTDQTITEVEVDQ